MGSTYRVKAVSALDNEIKIPTQIARDTGIRTNHISKVLSELKNEELVECINEDAKKGRLYRLTSTGQEIADEMKYALIIEYTTLFIEYTSLIIS